MSNYVICNDNSYGFTKDLIYKIEKEGNTLMTILDDNNNERCFKIGDKKFKTFNILY